MKIIIYFIKALNYNFYLLNYEESFYNYAFFLNKIFFN